MSYTTSLTFTGVSGRGPFVLSAMVFSTAIPVKDQIEVYKNGALVGSVNWSIASGTSNLILATALVPSDVLLVRRRTGLGSTYATFAAYGPAPAEGAIQNDQQALLALQEEVVSREADVASLQAQIDGLVAGGIGGAVLSDLADVSATAPTTGQVLTWDGASWAPATPATLAIDGGDASTVF